MTTARKRAPRLAAGRARSLGVPTRGTTNPNRLRRIDGWIMGTPWVARTLRADDPLAVDLGFGSSPITTVEWASRLAAVRSDTPVVGLDIDPERVRAGQRIAEGPLLEFRRGGFELAGLVPVLVRAMNVRSIGDDAGDSASSPFRGRPSHRNTRHGRFNGLLDAWPARCRR